MSLEGLKESFVEVWQNQGVKAIFIFPYLLIGLDSPSIVFSIQNLFKSGESRLIAVLT
jgi:hypothetical protein